MLTKCVLIALLVATVAPAQVTFGTTVVSSSGLHGRVYLLKPNIERLPNLRRLRSVGDIYTSRLNIWPQDFDEGFPGITDRVEWFGIEYSGRFWIETAGQYRFSLLSDDGARLRIDKEDLIDNDGIHAPLAVSAIAFLSRGVHTIEVSYFQGPRYSVALVLAVRPPDSAWRIFDTEDFPPPKDPSEWVQGKMRVIQPSRNPNRQR